MFAPGNNGTVLYVRFELVSGTFGSELLLLRHEVFGHKRGDSRVEVFQIAFAFFLGSGFLEALPLPLLLCANGCLSGQIFP